jgi:hypothetical protein
MFAGIYGDNDEAIIVGRKVGLYFWLAAVVVVLLGHVFLTQGSHRRGGIANWTAVGLALVA